MTKQSSAEFETAAARQESDLAGDVYYRTITNWMVSRLGNGSGRKCYTLAMAYDRAIDRLIARLKAQVISVASRRSIAIATKQKSLLQPDLDYLGNALMPFPKIRDAPVATRAHVKEEEPYVSPADPV